jgi:hypothetical protein
LDSSDPSYEILTARGITEVVEHCDMEQFFYIIDDPEVKAKLVQSAGR